MEKDNLKETENSNSANNFVDEIEEFNETDESAIFENQFLKRYNMIINLKQHLLICKTCKYVIEEEAVFNHCLKYHRLVTNYKDMHHDKKEEFYEELSLIDPILNSNLNIYSEEIIEGLKVYDGYFCKECDFITVNKAVIQAHMRQCHPKSNNINFEECNVQTLFLQPEKRRYFRVKKISRLPTPVESIERESVEEIYARPTSNSRNDQIRSGHQFVSSFYTESNWTYIFDKFSSDEIDSIVGLKADEPLEESVGKIFDQGEKFSKVVNHHFNQLIENPLSK